METFKYSDLLGRLAGFDASRKGRETGTYIDIHAQAWFPIIEALEAHDVFTAFQNDLSPAIGAAPKRALSGPVQPIDESLKDRDGRNIWYELALAAYSKIRDFDKLHFCFHK